MESIVISTLWRPFRRSLAVIKDQGAESLGSYGQKAIPRNHGHLYVNHDLLMTAGRSSAAIFDGENWKVLYGGAGLDEETASKIVNKVRSGIAKADIR